MVVFLWVFLYAFVVSWAEEAAAATSGVSVEYNADAGIVLLKNGYIHLELDVKRSSIS